jgi:hypothetical protein
MAEKKDLSPQELKEIRNEEINLVERNQPKFQSTRSILQFQDFDKDGLIDICDDLLEPITAPCKGPCVPNPSAIFPDWKTKDFLEPFVNPKLCYYQVAKVTHYKNTAPSAVLQRDNEAEINAVMKSRFEEFADQVIDSLLTFEQKENTEETVAKVKEAIRYEKYYLNPSAPKSRLQLLYSVPFDVIDNLPAAPPDEEEEEEDPPGTMYIDYEADQIGSMLIHVRKALDLYGRFHQVGQQLGDGTLKFVKTGSVFNLEDYGDYGIFTSSLLSDIGTDLEVFLNKKGFQMVGVAATGFFDDWFKDRITRIRIKILNYKLQTITIWTVACGQRPRYFNKKSCTALGRTSEAWKDPTAVAYFAKLQEMDQDINARVQIPWKETIVKYTYPEVYVDNKLEITGPAEISTCIDAALNEELKDLGQDILNDVFSLGDAVAWRWRKAICRNDEQESRADDALMGVSYEEFMEANMSEAYGMAQMQAFKRLAKDDQIFVQMCAMVLMSTTKFGPAMSAMSKLFEFGFQRLKWCGLLDLLQNAIKCLLAGLSFEDALNSLIKSALTAMNTEMFGQLLASLPADKQEEVRLKVQEMLASGDFLRNATSTGDQAFLGTGGGGLANATGEAAQAMAATVAWATKHGIGAPATAFGGGMDDVSARFEASLPWNDPEKIREERASMKPGNEGIKTGTSSAEAGKQKFERTLVPELDNGAGNTGNDSPPQEGIMQIYMIAVVEVYSDNLPVLLDELNKFPGAEIVSSIIALMDCPHPPLFNPGIMDFIKSLGFPICRNMKEIKKIHMENPFQYFTDFADITKAIWDAFKWFLKQVIMIVLINIMVKICEIIGRAICKAIEAGGNILKSMVTGEGTFEDAIKDAICGPDADDEQVKDTVVDLLDQLGAGGAALANRDAALQFGADLSASLTKKEMSEMFLGNASAESLGITDQILEFEHSWLRDALPNKNSVKRFMGNIGNLFPLEYREQLREIAYELPIDDMTPANPSMCASDEMIADFKALRCELLGGRASEGQCHKMFCDLREDMLQDLSDLGDLTQQGIAEAIDKATPPTVSTPGCDDGLIPYESPMQIAVANQVLGGSLDQLKIDYGKDMMGNGGFLTGDSSWGFINMVMSDTYGNPLTAHHRKAGNRDDYVNFASNLAGGGEPSTGFWSFLSTKPGFSGQKGQFPYWVGEWLMRQFLNAGISPLVPDADGTITKDSEPANDTRDTKQINGVGLKDGNLLKYAGNNLRRSMIFDSHNELQGAVTFAISFDQLGFNGVIGQNVELISVPDFGYNVDLRADFDYDHGEDSGMLGTGAVIIRRKARKGRRDGTHGRGGYQTEGADIALDFKDNARGMYKGGKAPVIEGGALTSETYAAGGNFGWDGEATGGSIWEGGGNPGYGSTWSYGFDLCAYYCDYEYDEDSKTYKNRFDDNIRVQMIEKANENAVVTSPLSDQVGDEFEQALFDLPDWIESIPIVGWAIENLVNWILGFIIDTSVRIKGMAASADNSDSVDYIIRAREFEFISVDDTLDVFNMPPSQYPNIIDLEGPGGINVSKFPKFAAAMEVPGDYAPPVYLLADMTNRTASTSLKQEYDNMTTKIYQDFAREIGENEIGWKYGATYDFLTTSDIIYGMNDNGTFVPYGAYEMRPGAWGEETRPLLDSDGVLGISYDQFLHGEDARVIYLNPAQFGGSYTNPPLYVKPIRYEGWYGFINVFFPEATACKPHSTDLIDFDEVKQFIEKIYPNMPEDPRLAQDLECIREVPFSRIMDRGGKTGMYALILAAIRIYASVHFFKAMGTFSKIMPKFPDNFSTIYSAYIVERMEEDFKDTQGAFWEMFNTFKDDEFWYGFLEQSVECYNFLVAQGEIEKPIAMGFLQNSFDTINDLQTDYAFPYLLSEQRKYKNSEGNHVKQSVPGLMDAKLTGDAGFFQSLEGYRESKNMEAVQSVDEEAKIILQQLVNRELTIMGEKLVKNMRSTGFNPTIFDLDFWIFQHKCQTSLQFLGPDTVEVPAAGIPTERTDDLYTVGGEFRVISDEDPNNGFAYADEYVGDYHVVLDEEGDPVYKAGATESTAAQDILTPVDSLMTIKTVEVTWESANALTTALGNSSEYGPKYSDTTEHAAQYPTSIRNPIDLGDVPDLGSITGGSVDEPFGIEKYISITDNTPGATAIKYTQAEAKTKIQSNNSSKLLSEVYPGSIKIVENEDGVMVGYSGHMGVRYGLNFYYTAHGSKSLIASVEVDALDLKIGQFRTMQPSSKLLHCLLTNLKNNPKYKLMTQYIFSYRKSTAMLAMYNDMAIMSSIGEMTPAEGADTCGPPGPLLGNTIGYMWPEFGYADDDVRDHWVGNSYYTAGATTENKGRHPAVRAKPGSICYIDREIEYKYYKAPPGVGLLSWLFPNNDPIKVRFVNVDLRQSAVTGNEGWSHQGDREAKWFEPATWGVQEWDTWDRILLRNSRSRIKQLFRTYYNSRDYRPGDSLLGGKSPVAIFIKNLKDALMPSPGKGLLPWYKKGKTRNNPYNANGELCDKNN